MSELIQADLLKWLRDNQWLVQNGYIPKAHAVIGDPPYFLGSITKRFGGKNAAPAKFGRDGAFQRQSRGFMGKTWDGFEDVWEYQAWVTEWATLLLDYVYPGAVVALFGSPRTYHRLAAGLEDAGFEIFDTLMFLHGQGFPKNHCVKNDFRDWRRGGHFKAISNPAMLTIPLRQRADWLKLERKFTGTGDHLKPAYEPIVLCRAPRGSATYAELAQTWGTGALNVDGGRIPGVVPQVTQGAEDRIYGNGKGLRSEPMLSNPSPLGRYPANLALDEAAARLLDAQSGESVSNIGKPRSGVNGNGWGMKHTGAEYADAGGASRFFYTAKAAAWEREAGLADFDLTDGSVGDRRPSGSMSQRIHADTGRPDTLRRNVHPTVKPIQLITWLATLLLPPPLDVPRRVLVPFAGSGSEMIGAQLAGWDEIVGIEREAEYCAINEARRRWWSKFKTYEQAEMAYRPPVETTDDLSDLPLFAASE